MQAAALTKDSRHGPAGQLALAVIPGHLATALGSWATTPTSPTW